MPTGRKSVVTPPPRFVGLDIGSTTITAAAAKQVDRGTLELLGFEIAPSSETATGRIKNPATLSGALQRVLARMSRSTGHPVDRVALAIPGINIEAISSSAERRWDTIERVEADQIEELRRHALHGPNAAGPVLASVLLAYETDGRRTTEPPVGQPARSLRVEVQTYIAPESYLSQLAQVLNGLGVTPDVLVPRALASAEAVLDESERRQSVVVIDIGGTSTDIAVFLNGQLYDLFSFPVGSRAITNDISTVLGLPFPTAEQLKRAGFSDQRGTGTALAARKGATKEGIDARTMEFAREIAEARLLQVFTRIRQRLDERDLGRRISAGAVVTGGGARVAGLEPIAARALDMPARIGTARTGNGPTAANGPEAAAAVGVVSVQAWLCPAEDTGSADEQPPEPPPVEEPQAQERTGKGPALTRWLREFVPLGDEA